MLKLTLGVAVCLCLVMPSSLLAQRHGWSAGSQYNRMYDPSTVETLAVEVKSVEKISPMKGMSYGVHLTVKTQAQKALTIHLGPAWFIENQDSQIEEGDQIEVTGSRVTFEDDPLIIAAKVQRGDEVLTLRNDLGVPLWSGWRKGAKQ